MEEKKYQDSSTEGKSAEVSHESTVDEVVNTTTSTEAAGPSTKEHLPGAIDTTDIPKVHRAGLSKSEHSINQIITRQDVENALKLTSMSFAANNQLSKNILPAAFKEQLLPAIKSINVKEFKVPKIKENAEDETRNSNIQRLMNRFNKDYTPMSPMPEVPIRVISTIVNEIQELPNSSTEPVKALTDRGKGFAKPNEVIVTPIVTPVPTPIEPKLSKVSEKKKTSGSLSERSDLGLQARDSLSSIGSNVCRICMTRGRERLISPCNCKGSLANVHLSCLERWLNQVGRNHCELCGYSYPAIRTPRYTVLQALRLWFGNPRNRSHLQSDCLIFWLLSTVTAGLLAVCIVGTQYFVIEGSKFGKSDTPRKDEGISHRITETAMDFFMAVVLCGYSVTVYLLWKDHYVMWNRWRRANVNVRLLLSPDSTPVPFVPRARYNVV